jgi:hypothetical protein
MQRLIRCRAWRVSLRISLPAQPVDATPANRLLGQHFSQGRYLSELYSIKPKQDSAFRLY